MRRLNSKFKQLIDHPSSYLIKTHHFCYPGCVTIYIKNITDTFLDHTISELCIYELTVFATSLAIFVTKLVPVSTTFCAAEAPA